MYVYERELTWRPQSHDVMGAIEHGAAGLFKAWLWTRVYMSDLRDLQKVHALLVGSTVHNMSWFINNTLTKGLRQSRSARLRIESENSEYRKQVFRGGIYEDRRRIDGGEHSLHKGMWGPGCRKWRFKYPKPFIIIVSAIPALATALTNM